MSAVYDAGVLVAADRNDRTIWADHRIRLEAGLVPVATAPVVAQVSRSPRQAQLRRFLSGCEIAEFSADDAHEVGSMLADAKISDVVDAHVVLTASRRSTLIITSDPDDIERLSSTLSDPVRVSIV